MNDLEQLQRDIRKATERGARPELLEKLSDQVIKLRAEDHKRQDEHPSRKDESFRIMFQKAQDEINKRCARGILRHIRQSHRTLDDEINQVDDWLKAIWRTAENGGASLEEFREILKLWYRLHIKAIEIYIAESKEFNGGCSREAVGS